MHIRNAHTFIIRTEILITRGKDAIDVNDLETLLSNFRIKEKKIFAYKASD